jgi:hypothetical protein
MPATTLEVDCEYQDSGRVCWLFRRRRRYASGIALSTGTIFRK